MSKEPRIVTISKAPTEEFEFFLRKNSDGSQYLTRITEGGPADRAGAKNEDKLIEVNGVNVENKSHEEVVTMIKASVSENAVTFKLLSTETESQDKAVASKSSSSPTTSSKSTPPDYSDLDLKPRLCKIEKRRNTFGFFLMQGKHAENETPGHFIKEIVELGAAVDSGLKVGDRVIAVGKTNVESLNHGKVVSLIKESGNKVSLLVVDVATYNHYKKRGKKITAHDAISSSDSVVSNSSSTRSSVKSAPSTSAAPAKEGHPRQVHLIKDTKDGFGFYLRCKLLQKEPLVTEEFIGDLEKGKSGDMCGLKENDLILSVNGVCISGKSHDVVVNMIRANPVHSVFIVIPSEIKSTFNRAISAGKVEKLIREKPKRVELRRSPGGYGFTLKYSQDKRHVFHDVEDGTPAKEGGIKDNEVLLAVNDTWVNHESHESAVGKIKASGDVVKLTISSGETSAILSKLSLGSVDEFFANWPKEEDFKYPYEDTETGERVNVRVHKPRLCHLVKGDQGYGFFLRGDEDGIHVLDRVEEGGAADKAGVKNGDLVIEINGENVESCDHDKAVEKIRQNSDHVDFLVVDEAAKTYFKSKGVAITVALLAEEKKEEAEDATASEPAAPEPRFCRLVKDYGQSFEFHLNSEPKSERPGQYVRRVTEGGIAEVAGLRNGDRVVCINGENIEDKSHEDVVSMIRGSGNEVTFLVVDNEADSYYQGKGIKITAALIKASAALEEEDEESTSTNVVEAEATVHDEPKADPVIDFPGPPAEEPDSVAEALEEIQEAVNDDETPAEEIKEAVEDVAQAAVAAEIAETIAEAVEDAQEEEVKEDIKEEIKEEIAEAIVEAAAEDKLEDVLEEVKEDVAEEIVEAVAEDVKEEIVEDIKEDIVEEVKEEIAEEVKEEIEEKVEDAGKPPSTFLDAIISGQQLKATPPPEEAPKKEFANGFGITKSDVTNPNLKPVEKVTEEVKPVENGVEDIHDPPPKPKFNVRSARAMFENPDSAPVKRNWTRQPSKTVANGQVKNPPPTRKLFTQTSAMKFNIVESSATFR